MKKILSLSFALLTYKGTNTNLVISVKQLVEDKMNLVTQNRPPGVFMVLMAGLVFCEDYGGRGIVVEVKYIDSMLSSMKEGNSLDALEVLV